VDGTASVAYVTWIGTSPDASTPTNQNLRNIGGSVGAIVVAQGFWSPGDGGGGVFYWDTNQSADDGGTVIVPAGGGGCWRRIYSSALNVKWFGAKGDGSTPDDAAIQSAIRFALGLAGRGAACAPEIEYGDGAWDAAPAVVPPTRSDVAA
jgi:hypothetical protein